MIIVAIHLNRDILLESSHKNKLFKLRYAIGFPHESYDCQIEDDEH